MSRTDMEGIVVKNSRGAKAPKSSSKSFKASVRVTPVFESTSTNILEISERGYNATGVSLQENGLLTEMPPDAVIPPLVKLEFKWKKWATISVYAKWTRQGHLFDFEFLIITPDDQARINAFLNA